MVDTHSFTYNCFDQTNSARNSLHTTLFFFRTKKSIHILSFDMSAYIQPASTSTGFGLTSFGIDHAIPMDTLHGDPRALTAVLSVIRNIRKIALSDVGFGSSNDYAFAAVEALYNSGYPISDMEQYVKERGFRLPDADEFVERGNFLRDTLFVINTIKQVQIVFYERVVQSAPKLFYLETPDEPARHVAKFTRILLKDCSFLYTNHTCMEHRERASTGLRTTAFATQAIVQSIRSAIPFGDESDYHWINYRTILMTAVGQMHGLLQWISGSFVAVAEFSCDELRIGNSSPFDPLASISHLHIRV